MPPCRSPPADKAIKAAYPRQRCGSCSRQSPEFRFTKAFSMHSIRSSISNGFLSKPAAPTTAALHLEICFRMRRNQYYWDQRSSGFKPLNQLKPAHSRHMNICDDAIICCVSSCRNKALPRGVSISSKTPRGKRVHQCHSQRVIIVDDCNFWFFWHSVSLPRAG